MLVGIHSLSEEVAVVMIQKAWRGYSARPVSPLSRIRRELVADRDSRLMTWDDWGFTLDDVRNGGVARPLAWVGRTDGKFGGVRVYLELSTEALKEYLEAEREVFYHPRGSAPCSQHNGSQEFKVMGPVTEDNPTGGMPIGDGMELPPEEDREYNDELNPDKCTNARFSNLLLRASSRLHQHCVRRRTLLLIGLLGRF